MIQISVGSFFSPSEMPQGVRQPTQQGWCECLFEFLKGYQRMKRTGKETPLNTMLSWYEDLMNRMQRMAQLCYSKLLAAENTIIYPRIYCFLLAHRKSDWLSFSCLSLFASLCAVYENLAHKNRKNDQMNWPNRFFETWVQDSRILEKKCFFTAMECFCVILSIFWQKGEEK